MLIQNPRPLEQMSVEDRERYMAVHVFEEARRWRQRKEPEWLRVYRLLRSITDSSSLYKAKMQHPYAFSAAEALKAAIYPQMFESDPTVQILDPNPDNFERNQMLERLLTMFVNRQVTNFKEAWDNNLSNLVWFGFMAPWTYFRSEIKQTGPYFQTIEGLDGTPLRGRDGSFLTTETTLPIRTYHAPYLETVSPFDTYIHPDGIRGFTVRDARGWALEAQSKGANPIYEWARVKRMFDIEQMSRKTTQMNEGSFSGNEPDRDRLADEIGIETQRHSEIQTSTYTNPRDKLYELYHYDDGDYSGTYARRAQQGTFFELRFFKGSSPDGSGNRLMVHSHNNPGEIYGASYAEITKDLLEAQTKFHRAMLDGASLTVNPMWVISQQMKMRHPNLIIGPGATLTAPTGPGEKVSNHVERLDMPQNWVNAAGLVERIQDGLDMAWAQENFTRGQVSGGRKTAREIGITAKGGQARIEMLFQRLTDRFAIPLFRKWLCMASIHYNQNDWVRLLGPEALAFVPPTPEEIVTGFSYSMKPGLFGQDKQTRAAQWPSILQLAGAQLPLMQIPHIHEMWKRLLTDMSAESVVKLMPSLQNIQASEYMALTAQLAALGGQSPGGSLPSSPGSEADLLRNQGGATAPPGPSLNLQGNGLNAPGSRQLPPNF